MKLTRIVMVFLAVFLCSTSFFVFEARSESIHPRNKVITKLYPRSEKLWFPEIPRITAFAALHYQRTAQAFFVHIGDEGETAVGGLRLREDDVYSFPITNLLDKFKDKYIVVYCH